MTYGYQITIALYVDNLMVTCEHEGILHEAIDKLKGLFQGATVQFGKLHSYIGMTFDFSNNDKVHIRMEGYVNDMLREYEVIGGAATPASADLFDLDPTASDLDKESSDRFHSRVAKLLFMAKRARPDILTAVSFLTTRVSKPTTQDLDKLQRVLKYINATQSMWLTLEPNNEWDIYGIFFRFSPIW